MVDDFFAFGILGFFGNQKKILVVAYRCYSLCLLGGLIVLTQGTVVAPFIYTIQEERFSPIKNDPGAGLSGKPGDRAGVSFKVSFKRTQNWGR